MSKVKTKILKSHEAQLTVEMKGERLQGAMNAAVARISRRIRVPGFRPGKAPLHVIASQVGMDAVQEEALEILAEEEYPQALEESGVRPYAPGRLVDVSLDPLVLTFVVALQPEIDLGNYRTLRVPYKAPDLSDELIENTIEDLRDDHAVLEPVERPAETGDALVVKILGRTDSEEPVLESDELQIVVGGRIEDGLPGISKHLIGLTVDETRTFDLRMPKDDRFRDDIRGKKIHMEVTCLEIYDRELPALDDEFAQSIGDYESVEDMRVQIRQAMERSVQQRAREEYIDKVIEALLERAKVRYPPAMVEEEIDDMVKDFDNDLRRQRLTLREYLQINNLSEEALRDDFRSPAEERLRTGLVLAEFVRQEGLTVADEEIEDEIRTMSLSFAADAQAAQRVFGGKKGRQMIYTRLLSEKATNRLLAIAKGEKVPPPTPLADDRET